MIDYRILSPIEASKIDNKEIINIFRFGTSNGNVYYFYLRGIELTEHQLFDIDNQARFIRVTELLKFAKTQGYKAYILSF